VGNPVRAGIVKEPGDYRWSSYAAHCFGINMSLWTQHPLNLTLGDNPGSRQREYRNLIGNLIGVDVIGSIRCGTNKGQILGIEKSRAQSENTTGDQP